MSLEIAQIPSGHRFLCFLFGWHATRRSRWKSAQLLLASRSFCLPCSFAGFFESLRRSFLIIAIMAYTNYTNWEWPARSVSVILWTTVSLLFLVQCFFGFQSSPDHADQCRHGTRMKITVTAKFTYQQLSTTVCPMALICRCLGRR